MNPRTDFADELLAREKGVSGERYADYRRLLDRAVPAALAARRPPALSLSRRAAAVTLLAAASVLVAVVLSWPRPEVGGREPAVLITPLKIVQNDNTPFGREGAADVIAVASVGEPFARGVRLHVEQTLKGEPVSESVVGWCAAPAGHEPGAKVLLFLKVGDGRGWGGVALEPLPPDGAERRIAEVRRYAEVARAPRSAEPAAAWSHCLKPEAGGLDSIACHFLATNPDPNAADALLAQLKAISDGRRPFACALPDDAPVLHRLAPLLAKIHEARAVRPLLDCAARLPRGSCGPIYQALPELCTGADAATVALARHALVAAVREPPAGDDDFRAAAQALARIADGESLGALLEAMNSRPITANNRQVLQALRDGVGELAAPERQRVLDAWSDLLSGCRAAPALREVEHELARDLAAALRDAEPAAAGRGNRLMSKVRQAR